MLEIDNKFISKLLSEAAENPRLRQNYDLRTSSDDNSQRMLNALFPGTVVPIHRHPNSTENVLLLHGKLVEVLYEEERAGDGIEPGAVSQGRKVRRRRERGGVSLDAAETFQWSRYLFENEITLPLWQIWDVGPRRIPYFQKIIE